MAVNLQAEILAICGKLGLDPASVTRIEIEPDSVSVLTYQKRDGGQSWTLTPLTWEEAPSGGQEVEQASDRPRPSPADLARRKERP
jgi:hypothetical protein